MTLLRSQFSFWIANILLHQICLLGGVRAFTGVCSYIYSQTRWQLHSKYISYLFTVYSQNAKITQKLPWVPFLTYTLSLCFPSTLLSIFNGLAMTSREKKPNNTKNNLRNPAYLGQVVRLVCGGAFPVFHLHLLRGWLRGASLPVKVCVSGVAHSTSKGTPPHIYYRSSKPKLELKSCKQNKSMKMYSKQNKNMKMYSRSKEELLETEEVTKTFPVVLPSKNPKFKQHNQE